MCGKRSRRQPPSPRAEPRRSSTIDFAEHHSRERFLWLIGFLAALSIANETGARELFPFRKIAAGEHPISVAVADLVSDRALDLVTADEGANDVSVFINLPESSAHLDLLAGVGLLGSLQRRQTYKRHYSL